MLKAQLRYNCVRFAEWAGWLTFVDKRTLNNYLAKEPVVPLHQSVLMLLCDAMICYGCFLGGLLRISHLQQVTLPLYLTYPLLFITLLFISRFAISWFWRHKQRLHLSGMINGNQEDTAAQLSKGDSRQSITGSFQPLLNPRSFKYIGAWSGLLVIIVTIASAVYAQVQSISNIEKEIKQTNELVKSAIVNDSVKINKMTDSIFDLLAKLYSKDPATVRKYEAEFRERTVTSLASPILNRPDMYVQPSFKVPGMIAFVVPKTDKRFSVHAMRGGTITSIMKEGDGCYDIRIAIGNGQVDHYAHLKEVLVEGGAIIKGGEQLGTVIADAGVSLSVGIESKDGNMLDPRPFLPPMRQSPIPQD